jgi:hypothetical protein
MVVGQESDAGRSVEQLSSSTDNQNRGSGLLECCSDVPMAMSTMSIDVFGAARMQSDCVGGTYTTEFRGVSPPCDSSGEARRSQPWFRLELS